MAVKTFGTEVLSSADTNTYLANSGLVYVTSATVGTAVASVTVSSAFNSTYDNYVVTYNGGSLSVDTTIGLQIGSAATNYFGNLIYGSYANNTVLGLGENATTKWNYCGGGGSPTCYIEIFNPFLTLSKECRCRVRYATVYGTYVGHLFSSTSYSAFTLSPSSGTMTGGTINVYGFRKA
jgi:hypothetical protein